MSNGDTKTKKVTFKNIFGRGKSSAVTSNKTEVILKLVNMHILEMEDVLFHLNSAVMMPENPQGKSSADGDLNASDEGLDVTGIKALALVFKQFEFDPSNKMVISGHTDTSGTAELNFKLSDERAKNILYLLNGEKFKWASNCYKQHRVEDYQQIMKYFEAKLNCGCDPGKIDNTYGDKTAAATKNFLKKVKPEKADAIYQAIHTDSKHRWTEDAWMAVYELYDNEMMEVLEISQSELNLLKTTSISFADEKKRFVGCGESFPIEQKEKNNYRSQKNRRVELLFFDEDEVPELNCPADIKSVHKEEDCPLWRKFYFVPLYIDPKDIKSVVYHLQLLYYDKIKGKQLPVPQGLSVSAYEDNHKKIPTETFYKNGTYFVKVQFQKKIKDPARTQLYFEIEAKNLWIYTQDEDADPKIIVKTFEDYKKLPALDKMKYYDLPEKWSSRNYWTRYDGDLNKGDKYENVFKDELKLKPFGNAVTKPDKGMVFSLDDIVLAESSRSQVISDQNANGNNIPLDDNSRITFFHVDCETKEDVDGKEKNMRRLKIYKPDDDEPVFTNLKFNNNLITEAPIYTRVISFCNGFYDVDTKRSMESDTSFNFQQGHVAGARLAIKNDPDVHHQQDFMESNASDKTNGYGYNGTFHFELHYLHSCAELDGKLLSYLLIFWSCRLAKNAAHGGTDADVANHRKFGMVNAMNRMNKEYLVDKNRGTEDILIRFFHFMEAKNNTNGGTQKHEVLITDNNHGSWNRPADASYRAACYQEEPGGWGGGSPEYDIIKDTDGKTYVPMANHHEMGHSTGCFDDYLYSLSVDDGGNSRSMFVPRFSPQHIEGGPYSDDEIARMKSNRSSRLRNYWKYLCWLHDMGKEGGPLNHLLKGTRFKINYDGIKSGKKFRHEFKLEEKYRDISKPAFREADFEIVNDTKNAKVDLLLYKLGDDQYSHFKNPSKLDKGYSSEQIYYAILPVKIKMAIKFEGGWDFANKKSWIQKTDEDFKKMLNGKFYIATKFYYFQKIYLFFVPHFKDYSAAAPADSNLNVEVEWVTGLGFSKANKTVTMARGDNTEQNKQIKKLIRASLAHSYNSTSNLTKNDFPQIAQWVNTKLGNAEAVVKNI